MIQMVENFEVPKTSPEVAQQVYREVAVDSKAFLRKESQILEKDNPPYLDGTLVATVAVSIRGNDFFAGQQIMAGAFFRYECTRRELEKKGTKIPWIGRKTSLRVVDEVEKTILRPFSSLIVVTATPEDPLVRVTRLRTTILRNEDPAIGEIVTKLAKKPNIVREINDIPAFIEGVHGAHLRLVLLEPEEFSSEIESNENPPPSNVPRIRRSIVRAGLREIVLDPHGFIDQTLNRLSDHSPSMAGRIRRASEFNSNSLAYLLPASLTVFCIMEEYEAGGLTLPVIARNQIKHPDPEVNQAIHEGEMDKRIAGLSRQAVILTLSEIEKTNRDFNWGIIALLGPYSKLGEEETFAAIYGVFHQYNSLKTGVS